MMVFGGYKSRKRQVESSINLFKCLFDLDKESQEEQEKILENLLSAESEIVPNNRKSIGARVYDLLHSKEILELNKLRTIFEHNSKYGTHNHPDNCYYDERGTLIIK